MRTARAAVNAYHNLLCVGYSPSGAQRVMELWFERSWRIGPTQLKRLRDFAGDSWAQRVAEELEFREDELFELYVRKAVRMPIKWTNRRRLKHPYLLGGYVVVQWIDGRWVPLSLNHPDGRQEDGLAGMIEHGLVLRNPFHPVPKLITQEEL